MRARFFGLALLAREELILNEFRCYAEARHEAAALSPTFGADFRRVGTLAFMTASSSRVVRIEQMLATVHELEEGREIHFLANNKPKVEARICGAFELRVPRLGGVIPIRHGESCFLYPLDSTRP